MGAVLTIDTERIKSSVDLRELAERYSREELHKESTKEKSGPCPKCGGTDRFHVTAQRFMCRQCHSEWGDAIEFTQWLHGVDFRDACAMLTGGEHLPAVTPGSRASQRKPESHESTFDKVRAGQLVAAAHERLFTNAGEPGQNYLRSRGIESHAWLTYGLGYVAHSPTAERAPAIVMPWYQRGEMVAVRFRFLRPQVTTDKRGQQRTVKIKSLKGSSFTGRLYGGQALPDFVAQPVTEGKAPAEALRTLIVCEGELNAVSLWQAAAGGTVDTLSVGSESQRIPESLKPIAERYGCVITWMDRKELAHSAAMVLKSHAVNSTQLDGDANDLLRSGQLSYALARLRMKASTTTETRERLLWDIWDTANGLPGIDSITAKLCENLARELSKQVRFYELHPGQWVTAQYAESLAIRAVEFTGGQNSERTQNA